MILNSKAAISGKLFQVNKSQERPCLRTQYPVVLSALPDSFQPVEQKESFCFLNTKAFIPYFQQKQNS